MLCEYSNFRRNAKKQQREHTDENAVMADGNVRERGVSERGASEREGARTSEVKAELCQL